MLVKSKIKYIQSLSQKQFRDSGNVFVAEGPKLVEELMQTENVKIKEVFATGLWLRAHAIDAEVTEVDEAMLERISFQKTPNQVLAICSKPLFRSTINVTGNLVLLLDGIQ